MSKNRKENEPEKKLPDPDDVPFAKPEDATDLDLATNSDPAFPDDSDVGFDLSDLAAADSNQDLPAKPVRGLKDPTPSAIDMNLPPMASPAASSSDLFGAAPPATQAADSGSNLDLRKMDSDTDLPQVDGGVTFDLADLGPGDSERTLGAKLEDFPEVAAQIRSSAKDPSALDLDLPPMASAAASSSNLFGTARPIAEPVDSATNLEPLTPVQPATDWIAASDSAAPKTISTEAIDAELAGPASGFVEGSDIFAGPVPPAVPKSDVSDVIAATAYRTSRQKEDAERPQQSRTSDIALNFNQPPGGSTIADPGADEDLPVAEAAEDGSDSLFGTEMDSSHLANVPNLPSEAKRDEADLGVSPVGSIDASSILADLAEPGSSFDGDSSAIRIESPGHEATIREDKGDILRGSTEFEMEVDDEEALNARTGSGSDLFADRTRPEFELRPESGTVDPFGDIEADQPSLSTAPSSIFSGQKPPLSGSSIPAAAAVPESSDSVEFSDHPDPGAADSGSFHVLPEGVGAVAFDIPTEESPEKSMYERIAPVEDDWNKTDPGSGTLAHRKKHDPTDEMSPVPATPVKGRPDGKKKTDPSVEGNWVADEEVEAERPRPASRGKRAEPVRSGGKFGIAGLALGLLAGVGLSAGVYFAGLVPNKEGGTPTPPVANNGGGSPQTNTGNPPPQTATAADGHSALAAGDPAKALKTFETAGATTAADKAALGEARLFARLRDAAAINADDAELRKARADLQAVVNDGEAAKTPEGEKAAIKAALHLGLSHEAAGDRAAAKAAYTDGLKKFPKAADVFQAALDRLAAMENDAGRTSRLTRDEVEQLASAAVILVAINPVPEAQGTPAPAVEAPEAGAAFWKAVNAAAAGKYDDATKLITEAKAAHEKRAKALAGRGLNPLTDPLEQIFPRSCDDLKAYWELRRTLYEHPGIGAVVKKDGVAKALDQLAGAEKRAVEQTKLAADLKAMNDSLATDLKSEKDKVAKIEKDLLAERDKVVKAEKDAKALVEKETEKSKKDLDAVKFDLTKVQDALKTEQTERVKAADALKARQTSLDALAKELQNGKLLPEKYDDAAVVAATRSAVSRATGPDLSKLIPSDLSAVAGTGLTTGHILDLASRTNKADAAAKVAAADISKLKQEHAAEVKSLTALVKKTSEDAKVTLDTELKKAADATAVKVKEAEMKAAADAKKMADAHTEQVKALEAAVLAEKGRTAEAERKFKSLGGAATLASQEYDRLALQTAARHLDAGITAYKARRYADAITAFTEAAKHNPNDALAWYFLGASHWAQGKKDEAKTDFKQAADREKMRLLPTREIDAALAPIQGEARNAITAERP
jgi:tetratricopeptide (TPR) repeat protein